MFCKILNHAAYRRNARTAGDDDQFFVPIIVQIEAVSIGSAHGKDVSNAALKHFIGHPSHSADGQIDGALADTADGDGGFSVLGNGNFKELARLHIAAESHAEGIFDFGMLDHILDPRGIREIIVHSATSSMAFSSLFTQFEKEMYSGQMSSQRPQPTHM